MAIPFHTPSEYGPVPVRNSTQDTNNNNNNHYVDLRNQRNSAQVRPQNVPINPQQNAQEQLQIGFVRQLLTELFNVYEQYSAMGTLHRQQVRPERDPLAAPPANRPFQLQQDQINQTSAGAGPSTPPRSPRLPLPDIIQCHAQLAFNFCASTTNTNNELPPRVRHPQPLEDSDEESLDVSLKIGFEIYRKTGRDLRYIADDLERIYNMNDRRRSRLRLSVNMKLMLKVAFPAVAILGGFGYYICRR